jgi:replicative DNA helicase
MSANLWRNEDIEGAVIGGMFLRGADPEVMEIVSTLPPTVFGNWQYREIFEGICQQARTAGIIDPVLLCESLPKHEATILEAGNKAWAKSSLMQYVVVMKRNAALRTAEDVLEATLGKLRQSATSEQALAALDEVKAVVGAIETEDNAVKATIIDDLLPEIIQRLDDKMCGRSEGRTILTGIDELDSITGGLDLTDLVLLAARPSMGKTEMVLDILDKVTESGAGVLFFSMEMGAIQIAERHVSAAGGISASRLKSPDKLEDEDWARISNGIARMTGRNIWIIDATDLNVDQIKQAAIRHKLAHPETVLVAVDYIGLVKLHSNSRHDLAVGEVSKGLKLLAKTNKTPVIALSQLSRSVESRPNKRPLNADLKNSGEIEADADIIMMLYRDEVYNPESPARGIAEINVTKNRNGALGTVYRRFHNGHFYPTDQAQAQQLSRQQPEAKSRRYSMNERAA